MLLDAALKPVQGDPQVHCVFDRSPHQTAGRIVRHIRFTTVAADRDDRFCLRRLGAVDEDEVGVPSPGMQPAGVAASTVSPQDR